MLLDDHYIDTMTTTQLHYITADILDNAYKPKHYNLLTHFKTFSLNQTIKKKLTRVWGGFNEC